MPTKITQLDDPERNKTVLRVEGEMTQEDAVLLEKIALEMRSGGDQNISIDLADLHFMDSDSAPTIKRLESEHGFEVEGLQYFLQKIVEETNKREK